MKRAAIIIVIVIAVILGAGWGIWRYAGLAGAGPVEGWIREYLVKVLRQHLNPNVEIGDLDYEYPRTVVISKLRLTESDVDILNVKEARLELAEIPRTGEPILIERIDLTGPAIQLVKASSGGLVGWSNLLRTQPGRTETTVEPGFRVSDFLRLRHAVIRDGSFAHRPGGVESEMLLTGINANLETPASPEGPGWYQLVGTVSRDQLFKINYDGRVDVNTGNLVINLVRLQGELDETRYALFPASLQNVFREHQIKGALSLDCKGTWFPQDVDRNQFSLNGEFTDTRFALGAQLLSSKRVDFRAGLAGDQFDADASGDVLEGNARIHADGNVASQNPVELSVHVDQVELAQLLLSGDERIRSALMPYQLGGRITGEMRGALAQAAPLSANIEATIAPLKFQLNGISAECPQVQLTASARQDGVDLDAKVNEIHDAGGRLAKAAHFVIKHDNAATDLDAAFDAAGGHLQGHFKLSAAGTGEIPYAIEFTRVKMEEAHTLLTRLASVSKPSFVRGEASGKLEGVGNWRDAARSTCRGNIASAAGQLDYTSPQVSYSSANFDVNLQSGRLELNGRLNMAEGGVVGKIGFDIPAVRSINASGKLESISLSRVLAAAGQSWNRPQVGPSLLDGRVSGNFALDLPVGAPTEGNGRFDLRVAQGSVAFDRARIPIDISDWNIEWRDRRVSGQVHMNLLSGRSELEGSLALTSPHELSVGWRASDIQLDKLRTSLGGTQRGRLQGRLAGDGEFRGQLPTWPQSLSGRGRIQVTQGHLLELPIFDEITHFLSPRIPLIKSTNQDEAHADFILQADGIVAESFDVTSPLVSLRGRGRVNYDGRLNLAVRAAAVPRLTGLLGPLDKLIDDASGKLVTYRVTGAVGHPTVRVDPLGLTGQFRE